MDTKVHFSSGKDDYETPDDLFNSLNSRYLFVLDAAANVDNHKCPRWFGPGGIAPDALSEDWLPFLVEGNIWLNPPYSRKLQRSFLEKVRSTYTDHRGDEEGTHSIVCLLPARTDTKIFHEIIQPYGRIEFLRGRVKFKGGASAAPFPSMIVVF